MTMYQRQSYGNFLAMQSGNMGTAYLQKVKDLRIWAPREFEFDIAFWGLT